MKSPELSGSVPDPRFDGIAIPTPRFADDDGAADPALAAALTAFAEGDGTREEVCAALIESRLLVPVVSVLDEVDVGSDGLSRDKSSHMATVSIVASDGRRALLAFSSTEALQAWDAAARPVPALAAAVAESALEQESDVLLLDVAGPVRFAVTGGQMRAIAEGRRWQSPENDDDVRAAVAASATANGLQVAAMGLGPEGELLVTLADPGPEAVDALERLAHHLVKDPTIRDRCEQGISLAIISV